MEPIRETVEALNELDPAVDAVDLLTHLIRLANQAKAIVPELVGVSIGGLQEGLTFTLVATAAEVAVLDAVQYAAGGPCVDGAHTEEIRMFDADDVLDEERWRLFAEATASRSVRSTLTLPVLAEGHAVGTVNLYAASRGAFEGHGDELARIFGAWAAGAVTNADLSFQTRREAEEAPRRVRQQTVIDVAVGILAAQLAVDVHAAGEHLRDAAARAGVTVAELAQDIVRAREWRDSEGQ